MTNPVGRPRIEIDVEELTQTNANHGRTKLSDNGNLAGQELARTT
jgi:hypothetical protein